MEQIGPNVYVETGLRGCNPGFVVTSEGVVMIDSPVEPPQALRWRELIAQHGPVRYLINTEHHLDHHLGNYFFGGTVVAHQGIREAILATSVEELKSVVGQAYGVPFSFPEDFHLRPATVTFSHRLHLYVGDHTFELLHLPGHTPSQIGVYIPQEKVLFTGDNVFHRVQTFLHEALPEEWLRSLEVIGQMEARVIVPGHGELCDRSYLQEQASFIREWVEAVKRALAQGLSREKALERISFLDRYPMDHGLAYLGPELQRRNINRLWDLLST